MNDEEIKEVARKHANLKEGFDIEEELYYNPSGMNAYKSFIEGVKWQAERIKEEEEVRGILTSLSLVNPVHLKMTSDGYGEFPDTYELTQKGIDLIVEQFKIKKS